MCLGLDESLKVPMHPEKWVVRLKMSAEVFEGTITGLYITIAEVKAGVISLRT